MSTQPSKATMWERYQNRPAIQPDERHTRALSDIQAVTNTQTELLGHILQMLTDHAANIDALKQELRQTKAFMDWATTTHEGILSEYNAIENLTEASK